MQLRLTLQYDGTRYHGWQVQPAHTTVQAVIEVALTTALREPVRVRAAGRTDAGVHATGQVVAVPVRHLPDDLGRLRDSLNALLPEDVVVTRVETADDGFDPRRQASSRVYEYRIWNVPAPSPFWRRYAWHVRGTLDVDAMDVAAAHLIGRRDLESFRGSDPEPVRSTVREVLESRVRRDGPLLVYRIEATAFLKHTVRNVVGTLVEVGRGVRRAESIPALVAARDRRQAAATAPAHGLVLVAVRYEPRASTL
jgi:tRNA pseudouridine38-40 synthase